MKHKTILGIEIDNISKKKVLDKILKYIHHPADFFHIVSLNPENLVITSENPQFKKIIETSQIKINDGIGVVLAGRWLNIPIVEKVTGVDLMQDLLDMVGEERLRAMLIGGKPNLALSLSKCYQKKYTQAVFYGLEGITNIKKIDKNEEKRLLAIVADIRPHIIFAAFGSPEQEIWFWRNRGKLAGTVCMGVGGGFDFLTGQVKRAPVFIRKIGMEWLFRLIIQPWRWKRQLRLIKFIGKVISQKIKPH